jgi:hypothetical protein
MSASAADVAAGSSATGAFSRFADRWIYVFMAALAIVTVLAGFIPHSIALLAAVEAGRRPPLPAAYHVHAVLMGAWLLLVLAQTSLVATGRRQQHRKLGLVAVVLAPALVLAMVGIVQALWSTIAAMPPSVMPPASVARVKVILSDVLLEQIRIAIVFPILIAWALLVRKRDSETHKRLMILSTLIPLPAAFDRIEWLPSTMPDSPTSIYVYTVLWLAPVLLYDVLRRGRIHRAYVIGLAINLPFVVASYLLWASPEWLAMAPKIVGVPGW